MQPLDIHSLAQNYQPINLDQGKPAAAPSSGKAKPGGLKGFLINNLPSIAGGVGLVGGEVLDPFGGGLVTGAAGSALGEGLKRKLLGESFSPKEMAIQAGETAALGGAGKALSSARTASKVALGAEQAGSKAATTGTEVATKPTPTFGQKVSGAIISKGQQEEAKLGAYAPGQKVAGKQLTTDASQKINQTLQSEGIGGLSAPERLAKVGDKLNTYNTTRSSLMEAHDAPLSAQDKTALTESVMNRLKQEAGGTASNVQNHATTFINELNDKANISDLGKYKTSLDNNAINWSRNPASVEPGQMIAAKAVRGAIKDFVEQKVPGIAEVNAKSTALRTAEGALMNSSGRLANLTTGGEGLWGRLLSGETAEKGKAIVAKGMQATGKALGGEVAGSTALPTAEKVVAESTNPAKGMGLLNRTVQSIKLQPKIIPKLPGVPLAIPGKTAVGVGKQVVGRDVGGAVINGTQPQDQSASATTAPDLTATAGTGDASASGNTSQYPQENMLYDIERDPTHASTYEALYKQLNVDNQTTQQKNEGDNATNALTALEAYSNLIKTAGGAKSGIIGGLENLGVKAKLVQGPTAAAIATADKARIELASQLAKTVTGGSKPAVEVINAYRDSLPSVSDTPATVEAKINFIKTILQARLSNSQGGSAAASDASNSGIDITNLASQLGQ